MMLDWWSGSDAPTATDIAAHEASLGDGWWTGANPPAASDIIEHETRLQGILPAGTVMTVPGDFAPQVTYSRPTLVNVTPDSTPAPQVVADSGDSGNQMLAVALDLLKPLAIALGTLLLIAEVLGKRVK